MTPTVLVTHTPEDDERRAIQDALGGLARITYLPDAAGPDRAQALQAAEVVLSKSFAPEEVPREAVSALANARLLQLVFAGADNIPFALLPEQTTVAGNTGAFAEPLAEHVLALVLALAKALVPKHRLLAKGIFDQTGLNTSLKGGVCGIAGLGGNGIAVARIMQAVGMQIYALDVSDRPGIAVDYLGTPQGESFFKVLSASNVLVLTVPLTRHTRGMIDRSALAAMKPDAILVNVARGPVIDQAALYAHLKAHPHFRVGIDTWWEEPGSHGAFRVNHPFFDLPNVIGSPHVADTVPGMMLKATRRAAANIGKYLRGENIAGVLNRRDYL
jgi:phosphoglycerate dehydrogenase-like enzyme